MSLPRLSPPLMSHLRPFPPTTPLPAPWLQSPMVFALGVELSPSPLVLSQVFLTSEPVASPFCLVARGPSGQSPPAPSFRQPGNICRALIACLGLGAERKAADQIGRVSVPRREAGIWKHLHQEEDFRWRQVPGRECTRRRNGKIQSPRKPPSCHIHKSRK